MNKDIIERATLVCVCDGTRIEPRERLSDFEFYALREFTEQFFSCHNATWSVDGCIYWDGGNYTFLSDNGNVIYCRYNDETSEQFIIRF